MEGDFSTAFEQAPKTAMVTMLVVLIAGLVLWLTGKRIARLSIAVSGLVLGAVAMFPVSQHFTTGSHMTLAWVLAGAVIGCLLAWLLYRVWMGVSMGAILCVAVPAAYILLVGTTQLTEAETSDTASPAPDGALVQPLQPSTADNIADTAPPSTDDDPDNDDTTDVAPNAATTVEDLSREAADALELTDEQRELIDKAKASVFEQLQAAYTDLRARVTTWWQQITEGDRYNLQAATAIGALVGLLLGLIAPNLSASIQTALVGSVFIVFGACGLIAANGHDLSEKLPFAFTPRNVGLLVGLITHLGIIIQWTIWRKQADK